MKKFLMTMTVVIAAIVLPSCGSKEDVASGDKHSIIGTWQLVSSEGFVYVSDESDEDIHEIMEDLKKDFRSVEYDASESKVTYKDLRLETKISIKFSKDNRFKTNLRYYENRESASDVESGRYCLNQNVLVLTYDEEMYDEEDSEFIISFVNGRLQMKSVDEDCTTINVLKR